MHESALVKIMSEPKNALVKQYKKLLKMDGVDVEFEEPGKSTSINALSIDSLMTK